MPHYHLAVLNNNWQLVRETPSSQIFRGETKRGLHFTANFHFTAPPIATVELVFIGKPSAFTQGTQEAICDDLSTMVLKRNHYSAVDFSVAYASRFEERSFSISENERRGYKTLHA